MVDYYLFDIDSTLVDATKAHLAAYKKAYSIVFGIDIHDDVLLRRFGKAEKEIHEGACNELGVSYNDSQLERIVELWEDKVTEAIRSEGVRVLPGVVDCLEYFKEENLLVGVITGNSRKVGEALLKSGNLLDYFSIKSYGDGAGKRVEILQRGIQQAKNLGYQIDKLTVIGDSPSDIEAGKLVNALTVGVTTGYNDRRRLESFNPDLVLDSLLEYRKILELPSKS